MSCRPAGTGWPQLGAEVGRVIAGVGAVTFDRPGFFGDRDLGVREMPPWSRQLAEMAANCMDAVPGERLDPGERRAWADLCAAHAPALAAIDEQARLVHADANPKNILVTRAVHGWRVDAVLDWEFSFSGCPYADAANMTRFSGDYPARLHRRLPLRIRRASARRAAPRPGLGLPRPRPGHVRPERPGHPPARAFRGRPGGKADPAVDRGRCTRRTRITSPAEAHGGAPPALALSASGQQPPGGGRAWRAGHRLRTPTGKRSVVGRRWNVPAIVHDGCHGRSSGVDEVRSQGRSGVSASGRPAWWLRDIVYRTGIR